MKYCKKNTIFYFKTPAYYSTQRFSKRLQTGTFLLCHFFPMEQNHIFHLSHKQYLLYSRLYDNKLLLNHDYSQDYTFVNIHKQQ